MKKLLLLILLSTPVFASQKYSYKDAQLDAEWANNYKEHKYPNWINARGSSATLTYLNVSSITLNGVNQPAAESTTKNSTYTFTGGVTLTSSVTINNINGTFIGLGRNRIINGDMLIDQRNEGALVTAVSAGIYGADRWKAYCQSGGVFKTQRISTTPPTGFKFYTHVTVTTAVLTPSSTDAFLLIQWFEGYNVRDFGFGAASANPVTISFWVRSTQTGQMAASLSNGAGDRSYPFTYTMGTTNTWEKKTVTFTGDTTGTWPVDNTAGMFLIFDLGSGSAVQGTANTWQAGPKYSVAGSTKPISSTSNIWDITGVQVELGSTATAYEYSPFPRQLTMCQRYYEKSYAYGTVPGAADDATSTWLGWGAQRNTTTMEYTGSFKVNKKSAPTMTYYNASGTSGQMTFVSTANGVTNRAVTTIIASLYNFQYQQTAAVEYYSEGNWTADADF